MNASRDKWGRLKRAFRLPTSIKRIESELGDEFRFHIEERTEQFIANGMSRSEAEREVQKRFGNYETHWHNAKRIDEDTVNQRNRSDFVRMLWREMQHSTRVLLRTPGFSLIAFLTLALGIGATTAIYSVVDAVVLRPLPYAHAEELVSILHPATVPASGERKWGLSLGGYFQFLKNNKTFSNIGLYNTTSFTVTNGGTAEVVRVGQVTRSAFDVLNARPTNGRLFIESDEVINARTVIVLSHEYFERRFGGDPSIVGKNILTNYGPYEVVGVAQPGLTLPMPGPFGSTANLAGFGVDLWIPKQTNEAGPFYNNHPYVGVGRLKNGVTIEQAQRDLQGLFSRFTEVLPQVYSKGFVKAYNFRVEVSALKNSVLGPTIPRTMWMVFGSVVLVLLIAVANVANLFIVRMESRRRESAIRAALGADGSHLAAHFLSESLILCGAAGVAGVFLARFGLRGLLLIAPTNIPRLSAVSITWASIGVSAAIAIVVGIVLGVVPLLRKLDIAALRDGGRGLTHSTAQRIVRSGLVVGQVALALVLLSAAGLMLKSFERLRHVNPGIDPSNTVAFDLSLPFTEYDTREKAFAFHRELQQRIKAMPGIVSVGGTTMMPLEDFGTGCSVVFREASPYAPGENTPCVPTPAAIPGFFETLNIKVKGRVPNWDDIDQRTQGAVITRVLAQRMWPDQDPIGKGISSNGAASKNQYRIVGVIDSLRVESLDHAPTEAVFYAATNFTSGEQTDAMNDIEYVVRSNGVLPSSEILRQMAAVVKQINPRIPFVNPRTMDDIVSRSMSRTTFVMLLLGVASAVALVLSAVGMYGVISYVVAQRRIEIGIRIALGASVTSVARMIVRQSVSLTVMGIAIGGGGAYVVGQVLTSLLFEVSPADPLVLSAVAGVLLLLAGIASLVPARRAAGIAPVEAMRAQ